MKHNSVFVIRIFLGTLFLFSAVCSAASCGNNDKSQGGVQQNGNGTETADVVKKYKEIDYPTPNFDPDKKNDVQGVILHHTAEPTVESSLRVLTVGERQVGTHVVIDTDGTRYIMCSPTTVTYHAGPSVLAGRESCNEFTIGIEFQGNTLEKPLTAEQRESAIEYLLPLIAQYNIPIENIVTHEMIREAYKRKYPNKRVSGKVDITQVEYRKFMRELRAALKK